MGILGYAFVFLGCGCADSGRTEATAAKVKISIEQGELSWQVKEGHWRLRVLDEAGRVLAYEGEHTGYATYLNGEFRRLLIPARAIPETGPDHVTWRWQQTIEGVLATVDARFALCRAGDAVRLTIGFCFDQPVEHSHFSWGLDVAVAEPLNSYHWVPGPTATAYSFDKPPLTLWMLSTYDHEQSVTRSDGCQALITIPRGRVMHSTKFDGHPPPDRRLEMHLRMPPGYEDANLLTNMLPAGNTARLHGHILLAPGYFDDSVLRVHQLQALEPLPARFSYRRHTQDVVDMLLDPAKFFEEHEGIIYYCHGEKPPESPRVTAGREGPGWGGAFDTETAYFLMQYAESLGNDATLRDDLKQHVRRMIDGWLTNPRFLLPPDLTWRQPGDMRASMSPSMEWRRRGNPPMIWTTHQAYMMYFLTELYRMGGWEDCKYWAEEIGEWTVRNQKPDGSLPGAWTVRGDLATPHGGFQPASVAWMISALLNLNDLAPDQRWVEAARRIADSYVVDLLAPMPEYGNGELELVVWGAKAIVPTSLAYIVWGYADAYERWGDPRYKAVTKRYGQMLLALGATWEPHEELLRGREKIECPPYGMDLKIAGGISLGTFRHFYMYQMNRNEIGFALMRAFEVLKDPAYLQWLRAFIHWHMHFVFTREVESSPVTTLGCSPQNHRWTSNQLACWDMDWGCTSAKMASLMLECLDRGYLAD